MAAAIRRLPLPESLQIGKKVVDYKTISICGKRGGFVLWRATLRIAGRLWSAWRPLYWPCWWSPARFRRWFSGKRRF